MTTIAYKDGVIAYDSRITAGNLIESDTCNKKIKKNSVWFFVSGAASDEETLINAYLAEDRRKYPGIDAAAIVVDKGSVFHFSYDEDSGYWKCPIDQFECYAIGSGHRYAYTAMDLGCDAVEAVKMAAKRDTCTGGRIRKFEVK